MVCWIRLSIARVSIIVEAVVIVFSFELGAGSVMQDIGGKKFGFEAGINGYLESKRIVDELEFSCKVGTRNFFVVMILQSRDKFFAGHVNCSFG